MTIPSHPTYCAASSEDSERFDHREPTWWEAALAYFEGDESPLGDLAQDNNVGPVDEGDRREVTCTVGYCRNPESPWEKFTDASSAREFLIAQIEGHDDYQGDWGAEDYPDVSDEALRDLAQELKCTIQEWEKRHNAAPKWWMVEEPCEISFGLAYDAEALATVLDTKLTRYEHDRCRWWPIVEVMDEGQAVEIKTLDLWEAAALFGLNAPEKPKRLPVVTP